MEESLIAKDREKMREQTTHPGNQTVSPSIGLAGVLMSAQKMERMSKAIAKENFSGVKKTDVLA